MEGLSDAQAEHCRKVFRQALANGVGLEGATRQLRELLELMLGFGAAEAGGLASQIAQDVMEGTARLRTIDSSVITRPGAAGRNWYCGPEPGDRLWPSLRDRLLREKGWSPESVDSIDECSNSVVACLSPPGLDSSRVRGLVVGHVQSGKTANMTAVIAKAVDRGYRLVLLLGGMTDSLRTQTQRRLETDLVRCNEDWWELLTVGEQDFQAGSRAWLSVPDRGAVLAVVKKDTNILRRFREFLDDTPEARRTSIPALVIDDETDQASPDVSRRDRDSDPSRINMRIREILERFPRFSYVGYTATPFANVLSDPADTGEDGHISGGLYPEDFIVSLPTPPDYFGPESLFGRDMTSAEEMPPENSGLNMIRRIPGQDLERIREIERSEVGTGEALPASLRDAVIWFIVSAAVMQSRIDSHCTMLVHTSTLTDAHDSVADALRSFVNDLRGGRVSGLRKRMTELLNDETKQVRPDRFDHVVPGMSELEGLVRRIVEDLRVWEDNYVSEDQVEFPDDGPPVWAIIVGGNRLARGVTLPGLLVSYFGRNTRQYDTLLQMGRWFGYRYGYEDLPRIWMTAETASNFRELATIEAEIREDISVYARSEITPVDWAVRIRQVPGMLVTRPAAMQYATTAQLSFGGEHLQTIRFRHHDREWLRENWEAGSELLERAVASGSRVEERDGAAVTFEVTAEDVLRFLSRYQTAREQRRTNTSAIRKYINEYLDKGLGLWNVAVITPRRGHESDDSLGPLGPVPMVERAKLKDSPSEVVDIKALMSKGDVLVDLPASARSTSNNRTDRGWKALKEYRKHVQGREHRPLLLLYPIRKDSQPRKEGGDRLPLNAVADILGMGIIFPEGRAGDYISVDLSALEIRMDADEDWDDATAG